jgi:hypothetical protein
MKLFKGEEYELRELLGSATVQTNGVISLALIMKFSPILWSGMPKDVNPVKILLIAVISVFMMEIGSFLLYVMRKAIKKTNGKSVNERLENQS